MQFLRLFGTIIFFSFLSNIVEAKDVQSLTPVNSSTIIAGSYPIIVYRNPSGGPTGVDSDQFIIPACLSTNKTTTTIFNRFATAHCCPAGMQAYVETMPTQVNTQLGNIGGIGNGYQLSKFRIHGQMNSVTKQSNSLCEYSMSFVLSMATATSNTCVQSNIYTDWYIVCSP